MKSEKMAEFVCEMLKFFHDWECCNQPCKDCIFYKKHENDRICDSLGRAYHGLKEQKTPTE